jgi:hypothetical protein
MAFSNGLFLDEVRRNARFPSPSRKPNLSGADRGASQRHSFCRCRLWELDFIHRGLNLSSLMGVPYIRGLYQNGSVQLYMNRGIGITGFPIRFGARPEITLLELART